MTISSQLWFCIWLGAALGTTVQQQPQNGSPASLMRRDSAASTTVLTRRQLPYGSGLRIRNGRNQIVRAEMHKSSGMGGGTSRPTPLEIHRKHLTFLQGLRKEAVEQQMLVREFRQTANLASHDDTKMQELQRRLREISAEARQDHKQLTNSKPGSESDRVYKNGLRSFHKLHALGGEDAPLHLQYLANGGSK